MTGIEINDSITAELESVKEFLAGRQIKARANKGTTPYEQGFSAGLEAAFEHAIGYVTHRVATLRGAS